MVDQCHEDAKGLPAKMVFLGDYIDRGPSSLGVLRFLMKLQSSEASKVICLKGNHEELALAAVKGGIYERHWLRNGGRETLSSYGISVATQLPQQHLDWMGSLPTHHDDGLRLFVHAGIDPSRRFDQQDEHDLLWIREPFLSDARYYARLVVHGHTPTRHGAPDQLPNRLNIDTGAVYGGPLTAAVFDAQQVAPIKFLHSL